MYTPASADAVWNDQGTLWAFKSDVSTVNDCPASVSGHFIPVPESIARGDQAGLENWSNTNNVFQLVDIQAHTLFVDSQQVGGLTFKREGGQLLLLRLPGV